MKMAWLKRASAMLFRHRTPRIHLYTICWNEADLLPFFFRHYDGWVDRFVIYDNGSSDQSRALLQQHPKVEVRDFPWSNPKSFVLSQQGCSTNAGERVAVESTGSSSRTWTSICIIPTSAATCGLVCGGA